MLIEVTAEDIATGEPGTCRDCPVAVAIIRATETPWVRVYRKDIEIQGSPHSAMNGMWLSPPSVRDFIDHFDVSNLRSKAEPFTFELTRKESPLR